jgi:hypothetical protein
MTDDMDPETLRIIPDFTEKIEVPKLAIQIMFDALCASLDFGSGFLDTEEVDALRAVAVILGVDPMTATPSGFVTQYPHTYTNYTVKDWRTGEEQLIERCKFCSQPETHACHTATN